MQGLASRNGDIACVSGSCGEGAALPAQLRTKLIPTVDPCNTTGGKRAALNNTAAPKHAPLKPFKQRCAVPCPPTGPVTNTEPGLVPTAGEVACCICVVSNLAA